MEITALFKESFFLLLKQPKLFLPKILVAFLYGIAMLVVATLSLETLSMFSMEELARERVSFLLAFTIGMFLYLIAVLAIDVLVNAMYPVMVKDFRESREISFKRALRSAFAKFTVVFPAIIFVEFAIAIPFALLFSLLIAIGSFAGLILSAFLFLALSFALVVLFYVVYPVAVLRPGNFVSALVNSAKLGKSNLRQLSVPSLIPFFLSLANFALAFFANDPAFLAAFIVSRFLIALVAAYHMVLNPNVYFALVGVEK